MEYKDAPLRFAFILEDREEEVKIVEPEIDLPFPEEGRLVVDHAGIRICDAVFRFDVKSRKPYRLEFYVLDGIEYPEGRRFSYGAGVASEGEMQAVYRKPIVSLGNLDARIEMSHGKARLRIAYLQPDRPPTNPPA